MDANSCLHSYILKINIQDIQSIKSPHQSHKKNPGFFRLAKSSVVCLKHLKPPKSRWFIVTYMYIYIYLYYNVVIIIMIIAIIMTYNDHLGE